MLINNLNSPLGVTTLRHDEWRVARLSIHPSVPAVKLRHVSILRPIQTVIQQTGSWSRDLPDIHGNWCLCLKSPSVEKNPRSVRPGWSLETSEGDEGKTQQVDVQLPTSDYQKGPEILISFHQWSEPVSRSLWNLFPFVLHVSGCFVSKIRTSNKLFVWKMSVTWLTD